MRRLFLAALAIVAIGMSFPVAQQIQRSVQLSQDPGGPIGFDTQSGVYFPGKLYTGANQTSPTLTSCGTSPTIAGTNLAGEILAGSAPENGTCTATWTTVYSTTPYCVVSTRTSTPIGVTATPNGMLLQLGGNTDPLSYFCIGQGR